MSRFYTNGDVETRFWPKVKKGLGKDCWIWLAGKSSAGYGSFRTDAWKHVYAHRLSWELMRGPIPDGLLVLHHCDNPSCVNPDHLFLGTNRDNVLDALKKGRLAVPPPPLSKRLRAELAVRLLSLLYN